jgi:riboflavin kinase/FMN adenylyltransferase
MTTVLRRLPDQPIRTPLVAIGNFDGVHRGHQAIITEAVRRAAEVNGTSMVLTFDPHPVSVLHPEAPHSLLTTADQKLALLEALRVDVVLVLPFTLEFARRSAEQFVREDLGERLGAREVFVGRNFKFGKGREGRVEDLERLGRAMGMRVVVGAPVLVGDTMVSSSAIRGLLRDGRVEDAEALLGRPYAADGVVSPGDGRGRALGYPTANLKPGIQMLPKWDLRGLGGRPVLGRTRFGGSGLHRFTADVRTTPGPSRGAPLRSGKPQIRPSPPHRVSAMDPRRRAVCGLERADRPDQS